MFRGGGCFSGLGPTGNVNAVLCAREFVWEVVSKIGELDLSAAPLLGGEKGEGMSSLGEGGRQELEEEEEEERKDRENFARIRECVETVLDGYRKKFFSPLSAADDNNDNSGNDNDNENTGDRSDGESTRLMKDWVLPPDGLVEDAIVVKKGLLFFDYLHRLRRRTSGSRVDLTSASGSGEEDVDADVDAGGDTDRDVDVEGDIGEEGILGGDVKVKDEPLSDAEIVEETEQEEEDGIRDDDDANTSADEIDNILPGSSKKRKRSTAMVTRRRNYYQARKKLKAGVVGLGFGEGHSIDGASSDEVDEEENEDLEEGDEEEEEDIEDEMLLNADWACPGCGGSI